MIRVETEQELDGRWIAEIPDLPGVMSYGETRADAIARVRRLEVVTLRDRQKHGDPINRNDP